MAPYVVERYRLVSDPSAPHAARSILRDSMERACWQGDTEAALLLTSELVTNALLHAGAVDELRVSYTPRSLLVEPDDPSDSVPDMAEQAPSDESGRGLVLMHKLALRWGAGPREDAGKTVWFELPSGGVSAHHRRGLLAARTGRTPSILSR